jgi:hypothetical protein
LWSTAQPPGPARRVRGSVSSISVRCEAATGDGRRERRFQPLRWPRAPRPLRSKSRMLTASNPGARGRSSRTVRLPWRWTITPSVTAAWRPARRSHRTCPRPRSSRREVVVEPHADLRPPRRGNADRSRSHRPRRPLTAPSGNPRPLRRVPGVAAVTGDRPGGSVDRCPWIEALRLQGRRGTRRHLTPARLKSLARRTGDRAMLRG